MVLPLIFNFSSPFSRLLRSLSSAPTTIGITITPMFLSCFSSLARSKYYYYLLVFHTSSYSRSATRILVIATILRSPGNFIAEFSCAVVWIVSILTLISSSPSLFFGFLGTVPRTLNPIAITIIFTLHNFFSSLARFKYLFKLFAFLHLFFLWFFETAKSTRWHFLFFVRICWFVFIS